MTVPLVPKRSTTRTTGGDDAVGSNSSPGRRFGVPEAVGLCALATLCVAAVTGTVPVAPAVGLGLLIPAAVVDAHVRRLPDVWVGSAALALAVTIAVSPAFGDSISLLGVVVGVLAMAGPITVLHLISPMAMGFGDVKASIVLGASLGTIDWRLAVVAPCVAGLSGAAYGLATHRRTIAFGPWLVFGAFVTLLAHRQIIDALFAGTST